jgi:hypothetical protein
LCLWLTRADRNYVEGRFLARSGGFLGGGHLLWLSFEQLAKTLILESKARKGELCLPAWSKDPTAFERVCKELDGEAKNIARRHDTEPLVAALTAEYPELDLTVYRDVIDKVSKMFLMRYPSLEPWGFATAEVDAIDQLYFTLRDRVDPAVGMGSIDMLCLFLANNKGPLYADVDADVFVDNKAIRLRPGCAEHPKLSLAYAGPGAKRTETLRFPPGWRPGVTVEGSGASHQT